MLAIRIAFSKPGTEQQRNEYLEAHKQHLRSGELEVILSGPVVDEAGNQLGAIVAADVTSLSEMAAFSAADPFVVNGVYTDIEICEWRATVNNIGKKNSR